MMILTLFMILISIVAVDSALHKFKDPRELDPEDIGKYHTEAFTQLADKYSSKKPNSMKGVELDMFKIVASYCDDFQCMQSAYQSALEEIPLGASSLREVYPDDLSSSVKVYLDSFEATIQTLNVQDTDKVLNELETIQEKLREDNSLEEEDKYIGLAAGSIAIESTKLWTSVFNDPGHPLHAIRDVAHRTNSFFQKRRLQDTINLGALEFDFDLPFTVAADFTTLAAFKGIPFPAIFASLWAFAISSSATIAPSTSFIPSITPSTSPIPTTLPSISPSTRSQQSP